MQSRDDGTKGSALDLFLAFAAWMMTALAISFALKPLRVGLE